MGYINFGSQRYFDIREVDQLYYPFKQVGHKSLPSDCTRRPDSNRLKTGDYENAQIEKIQIEQL